MGQDHSLDHLLLVTPLGRPTINNINLNSAVVYGRQRQHFKQMVVNVSTETREKSSLVTRRLGLRRT
jgi:hypothetical protein